MKPSLYKGKKKYIFCKRDCEVVLFFLTKKGISTFVFKMISVQVTKNPEWLEMLDAPTSAPAWPTPLHSVLSGPNRFNPEPIPVSKSEQVI